MTLSLRARQIATVTALVVCSMVALASVNLASLVQLRLEDSRGRGELLARTIFHRARLVVPDAADPAAALREDPGIRAILESSIAYTESVTYATIVNRDGIAIAHSSPLLEGQPHAEGVALRGLLETGPVGQLAGVYRDATLEIDEPLLLGDTPFGSIRIGLSTVLIRSELQQALRPAIVALLVTLSVGLLVSLVLARWALRPIHMIRAGLSQLGRGDSQTHIQLPAGKDFTDLGESFDAISARLADRDPPSSDTPLESVIERLEEAVAILDAQGAVLFTNSAMKTVLPEVTSPRCLLDGSLPENHPYRRLVTDAVVSHQTHGPITVGPGETSGSTEHEITAHAINNLDGDFVGVMLVVRDIGYLSSVQSTVESSQQLASLGGLLAGVAHEVKNPLNAMTIHLELLRQKLLQSVPASPPSSLARPSVLGLAEEESPMVTPVVNPTAVTVAEPDAPHFDTQDLLPHVTVIGDEVKRLDQVIQGFLRFIRPDDLQRVPIELPEIIDEVLSLVTPEADRIGVRLERRIQTPVPALAGDRAGLRQALLNLALNACQAMQAGGTLKIEVSADRRWVVVDVSDTGVGMTPEVLERIFELYYTTRADGSGIGLSMVYRIVKLHGGQIEVESTAGGGTRFRLMLPRADSWSTVS